MRKAKHRLLAESEVRVKGTEEIAEAFAQAFAFVKTHMGQGVTITLRFRATTDTPAPRSDSQPQ